MKLTFIAHLGRLFFSLAIVVWLSGCASGQKMQGGGIEPGDFRTQKVEPEARAMFQAAERALSKRDYDEARRLYNLLRSKYPKGKAAMVATYRLGTVHYYQEEYGPASREFVKSLAKAIVETSGTQIYRAEAIAR